MDYSLYNESSNELSDINQQQQQQLQQSIFSSNNNCSNDDLNINEHFIKTMKRLYNMYIDKKLCDVTLICNNEKIQAHRVILSSASDYFYAMFNNDLLESRKTHIIINDIDSNALISLINYIYTGEISLNDMNIYSILSAASMLQLDKIIKIGYNYLSKNLNISNCISTFRFSDKYLFNQLNEISKQYILDNFMDLINSRDFYELTYNEIELFLSSNDLNINNEEFAFETLVKWINYDLSTRLSYFSKLLAHIKLPLISPLYLTEQIESNKLIKSSNECQNLFLEAATYHILSSYQQQPNYMPINSRTIPRRSTVGYLLAIGGIVSPYDPVKGQAIEKYDCRLNKWSIHTYMNSRRLQCGVSLIDKRLYVVGGREGLKTLNTVEYFDFDKQIWSCVNSMNTHRHGLVACCFNGLLYAIGGHDGWSFLNNVERFDLETGMWTFVAPMLNARSTLGVGILNNRLYAIGGRDASSCLNLVEYYNPNSNRWTACAPMLKKRGSVGVAVLNGCIYAIGGHELPNTLLCCKRLYCGERYDPKTDQWTIISSMNKPREAIGIATLGLFIYVAGGYDGSKYLNDVEKYDPNKNEWTKIQSLNNLRAGTTLVQVRNDIINKDFKKKSINRILNYNNNITTNNDSSIIVNVTSPSSSTSTTSTPPLSKSLIGDYDEQSTSSNDDLTESSFHTI